MVLVTRSWPMNQAITGGGREPEVWQLKLYKCEAITTGSAVSKIVTSSGATEKRENMFENSFFNLAFFCNLTILFGNAKSSCMKNLMRQFK